MALSGLRAGTQAYGEQMVWRRYGPYIALKVRITAVLVE